MRVLWLSPWMRTLARVHAEALTARGHEVLLVTSDQHPESGPPRPYELVLDPRPKTPDTWVPTLRTAMRVRRFDPAVTVCELVRDPRWLAFAPSAPRITVVHDDRPHDAEEQRPGWERALFDRAARRSAATVAFSHYVASRLPRPDVRVVPLTSDLDDALVPQGVTRRRDFVALGRLRPYKNLEVTLRAWEQHVTGPHWAGDDLVLLGDGEVPTPLPAHVRHHGGSYRYADVLPVLARAKGSVAHYRRASQSGVQVLSMQLGVTPVVSPQGALPEFQPPGEDAVAVDDVAGLAARFDELAPPAEALERGLRARAHYVERFSARAAAAAWETVLTDVTGGGATSRRARPIR